MGVRCGCNVRVACIVIMAAFMRTQVGEFTHFKKEILECCIVDATVCFVLKRTRARVCRLPREVAVGTASHIASAPNSL